MDFEQLFNKGVLSGKDDRARDEDNHYFTAFKAALDKHMTQKSRASVLVVGGHTVFRHH